MDAGAIITLVILVSIAPAVFLLWYFYRIDKWEREPLALILGVFIGGCLVAVIVYAIAFQDVNTALLGPFARSLHISSVARDPWAWVRASLYVAVLAQPLLWGVVRFGVWNRKQFNEPVDGIVYGAAAGLGFAFVQNVVLFVPLLTFSNAFLQQSGFSSFADVFATSIPLQVVVPSLLFTIPLQALFSAVSCYGLGIAKFAPPGRNRNFTMFAGLFVAILMQFGWIAALILEFPVELSAAGLALFYFDTISFAVAAWILVTGRIDAALNRSPYNPSRSAQRPTSSFINRITSAPNPVRRLQGGLSRFCPRCGTRITRANRFCPNCGTQIGAEPG